MAYSMGDSFQSLSLEQRICTASSRSLTSSRIPVAQTSYSSAILRSGASDAPALSSAMRRESCDAISASRSGLSVPRHV